MVGIFISKAPSANSPLITESMILVDRSMCRRVDIADPHCDSGTLLPSDGKTGWAEPCGWANDSERPRHHPPARSFPDTSGLIDRDGYELGIDLGLTHKITSGSRQFFLNRLLALVHPCVQA